MKKLIIQWGFSSHQSCVIELDREFTLIDGKLPSRMDDRYKLDTAARMLTGFLKKYTKDCNQCGFNHPPNDPCVVD